MVALIGLVLGLIVFSAGFWFATPFSACIAQFAAGLLVAVLVVMIFGRPEGEGLRRFFDRQTPISRQPLWLQTSEILVLIDLLSYGGHRWFHRLRLLWGFHSVHHSSEWIDWLSSVRVHPLNELGMRILQAVPLLLLGFNFLVVVVAGPALTLYAIFLPANVPWGFGPLRYVIATPIFHRWHHTKEGEGLDKNFVEAFVWPDMLFGTFYMPKGRPPEAFGILGTHPKENVVSQPA